ncbi:hypothetical protein ARMGADRAFT_1019838, partial [Armillaria gallica]
MPSDTKWHQLNPFPPPPIHLAPIPPFEIPHINRERNHTFSHFWISAKTVDDLLRWADRYDTERDGHWFERLGVTRIEDLYGLPWKIKGRMHISLSDIGRKGIPTGRLGCCDMLPP